MLLSNYDKHLLLPQDRFKDVTLPEKTLPRAAGAHHKEWLDACKGGKPTLAPFTYGGPLTEANHLASIAYRLGKKLEWDSANLRATNAPEADHLIHREYRKGWSL
jgi:hypothetical protein